MTGWDTLRLRQEMDGKPSPVCFMFVFLAAWFRSNANSTNVFVAGRCTSRGKHVTKNLLLVRNSKTTETKLLSSNSTKMYNVATFGLYFVHCMYPVSHAVLGICAWHRQNFFKVERSVLPVPVLWSSFLVLTRRRGRNVNERKIV